METLFLGLSGATISECQKYRYDLYRVWDESKPIAVFVMLNPSKADANRNDNTLTKIIKIASYNGFGSLWVVNLFAYRATDQKELLQVDDPIGPENMKYLSATRSLPGATFIYGWGAGKTAKLQSEKVAKMFTNPKAIFINKDGSPKHPLFCKDQSKLIPFNL